MFRTSKSSYWDEPERELLARVAAWPAMPTLEELDAAVLKDVASREGIDFATALLYDRLRASPKVGQLDSTAERPENEPSGGDTNVVVIPGAFHAQRRETGADGRRVIEAARRLGCVATVVDVPGFGSPAENGRRILEVLARRPGHRTVLVSLSKGSLDVYRAFERPDVEAICRNVDCWISLSGISTGTPLVGWLRRRPWRSLGVRLLFAWHRLPYHVLGELDRDYVLATGETHRALRTARRSGLRMVHVVGFPLRRHLSCPLARRGHRRLSPLGPNDGSVLLADVCQLPGEVYPIWGADHYLRLPGGDVGTVFARVLSSVSNSDAPPPFTAARSP